MALPLSPAQHGGGANPAGAARNMGFPLAPALSLGPQDLSGRNRPPAFLIPPPGSCCGSSTQGKNSWEVQDYLPSPSNHGTEDLSQARQANNLEPKSPWSYLTHGQIPCQKRQAEKTTGYSPMQHPAQQAGMSFWEETVFLSQALQQLTIDFAQWEKEAIRAESFESLLKGMILFGTGYGEV